MTELQERLRAVTDASGAAWAALFPCHGGVLTSEGATYCHVVPRAGEELLRDGTEAVPVPGRTAPEQALRIGSLFSEKRRGGKALRLRALIGREGWMLVLERGGDPAPTELLAAAVERLAAAVGTQRRSSGELGGASAFVGADGRLCLLADGAGHPVALSPLMRQELGGDRGGRPFVPTGRKRLFLQQIREAIAMAQGEPVRLPARGLDAPGELRIEPLPGSSFFLAVVEGEAALQAGLRGHANTEVTPREITCGLRLAEGKSYKEIAAELGLSPDTVKLHLRALYQKLEVDGRDGLVARLAGLTAPSVLARRLARS